MRVSKIIVRYGLLAILGVLCNEARASEVDLRDILQVTGVRDQLQHLPDLIRASFGTDQTDSASLKPYQLAAIQEALVEAFAPAELEKDMVNAIETKGYETALLTQALTEWRVPFVQQMVLLESQASTPEAQIAQEAYRATIEKTPPSQVRLQWVQVIDEATQNARMGVEVQTTMMRVMYQGTALLLPRSRRPDDAAIEVQIQAQRKGLEQTSEAETRVQLLYTYREVNDSDLARYAAFLQSPTSQYWIERINAALIVACERATQRFLYSLGEWLRKQPDLEAQKILREVPT